MACDFVGLMVGFEVWLRVLDFVCIDCLWLVVWGSLVFYVLVIIVWFVW